MKEIHKIPLILLIIICGTLFCSFSKNNNETVTGYIHVYGNEPFTYLGIKTADDKLYTISASEEEISKLWKTQGTRIEISGIIIPSKDKKEMNMLKDGKIEVIEWKYVK